MDWAPSVAPSFSYYEKFSVMSKTVCPWIFLNLQRGPNYTNLQERDAKETKLEEEYSLGKGAVNNHSNATYTAT